MILHANGRWSRILARMRQETVTFLLQIAQILQAFLTPVIAGVVAYIAWQQWKANTLKLTLERYERRLRVYDHVIEFLGVVMRDFKVEIAEVQSFRRNSAEADFIFGPEIPQYLDELVKEALSLRVAHLEYRDVTQTPPPGYDHQKIVTAMHEGETWFSRQHDVARDKFKPYLDVSK